MKTIVHISDMHFGRIDIASTRFLLTAFSAIRPDVVIISGDLTQRARTEEFRSARAFLEDLKKAGLQYFVIPGNHDIEPFFKPLRRTLDPYQNYKKYISDILEPTYSDSEIAIASIDTARPLNLKNGELDMNQIRKAEAWFSGFPAEVAKIVVTHHPFDLPLPKRKRKLVRRAHEGVEILSARNIDLYLAGHYHHSSVITTKERYHMFGSSAVAIQAGTLSKRQRGEVQSFNVIRIDKPLLSVETYLWDSDAKLFSKSAATNFELIKNSWTKSPK